MIGRNGNIDHSSQAQLHDNKAAEYIPGEEKTLNKKDMPVIASETEAAQKPGQAASSLRNMMRNGWNGIFSRAIKFWNDTDGRQEDVDAVLITSTVKSEKQGGGQVTPEKENARKINDAESAAGSGLEKEQGSMRKFFQQFGETILNITGRWKRTKKTSKAQHLDSETAVTDTKKHSHLLDSYNKAGQYSTLGKDPTPESNFRIRG